MRFMNRGKWKGDKVIRTDTNGEGCFFAQAPQQWASG